MVPLYGEQEARAILLLVFEVRFQMTTADVFGGGLEQLNAADVACLNNILQRLEKGEPVQYVLGQADFAGRTFHVERGVLIPRPETAELCGWIARETLPGATVLDVGCGSGCIAITLSLDIKNAEVTAWDVSDEALKIAKGNAEMLHSKVHLVKQNALMPPADESKWDVIVSNPPYVCEQERATMERNVLAYEPELALFVPDDDALRFYRAIAEYGRKALKEEGKLYFEINPLYAEETQQMLSALGYVSIESRNDMFGKERFVKAVRRSAE